MEEKYTTYSAEETIRWGQRFGKGLVENSIICIKGDLGAGKTTLIKGITQGYCGTSPDSVVSPTYVLLNIYSDPLKKKCLYHFDLYRLSGTDEFLSLGFEEFFSRGGVSCIEWSERIAEIIPTNAIDISLISIGEESRLVIVNRL